MKARITIHREGRYFVAIDTLTHVADQGITKEEAINNLTKGLREHHRLLQEIRRVNYPALNGGACNSGVPTDIAI